MHFEGHAEVYERFRPPYPDELWARLRDAGLLRTGLRVLELGAGTGEATTGLAVGGAIVTAIEPGWALAERLHQRVPQAEVIVATAEDAALPSSAFDVAVVATAIHWLDLYGVVPKLHRVLKPGGQLAVWATVFGDPEVTTPFRQRVSEIVARRSRPGRPSALDTRYWTRELTASGQFTARFSDVLRWSLELEPDEVHGLFSTFSDWTAEEADAAAQAVTDLGGRATEHYVTTLMVLDRVDN